MKTMKVQAKLEELYEYDRNDYTRNINQEMDDLLCLTGSESWDELMAWFGGMTQAEIETECDKAWGQDDNSVLAARIHDAIEVTRWQR